MVTPTAPVGVGRRSNGLPLGPVASAWAPVPVGGEERVEADSGAPNLQKTRETETSNAPRVKKPRIRAFFRRCGAVVVCGPAKAFGRRLFNGDPGTWFRASSRERGMTPGAWPGSRDAAFFAKKT